MLVLTTSLVFVLAGGACASAAAAARFRLPIQLLPAVIAMAFALLSLPAWLPPTLPSWLVLVGAPAGFAGLLSSVWALRTRTAQLRLRWWRRFERELDYERMLHTTPDD